MAFLNLCFPIFFLLSIILPPSAYSATPSDLILPINIKIDNQMMAPLTAHCRVVGLGIITEIGTRTLKPKSTWDFVDNLNLDRRSGRAECDMSTGSKKGHFNVFDFFRDFKRCGVNVSGCNWSVRSDGLYLLYNGKYNLVYPW